MPGSLTFLRIPVRVLLFTWLAAEILALALVVSLIGWTGAILAGLATSALGLIGLKRAGSDAVAGLRRAAHGGTGVDTILIEGGLIGVGSFLLILPGFVSDLVGIALAAPSVRGLVLRLARRQGKAAAPDGTIDLDPDDWHPVADPDQTRFPRSR